MNESRRHEDISFSEGQIVWNYIFLLVLFLLIALNNGLILVAVLSQKRLHSQINSIVVASLALAQLTGGLIAIPMNITLVQDYKEDSRLDFARVVTTFCGVASQLHFAALCVDRCLALLYSVTYGDLKRGSMVLMVCLTWVVSIGASLLYILDFNNYSVFIVTTFFALPWLVELIGHGLVYRNSTQQEQTTISRKELRLAKSFAAVTLVSSLLWLPYVITVLLRDHCNLCDTSNSSLELFVLYLQLISLTFSSAIYYKGSFDFRLAFKIIAKELRGMLSKKIDGDGDVNQGTSANDGGASPRDGRASAYDGVTNHVNMAMFVETENRAVDRKKRSAGQQSPPQGQISKNDLSTTGNEEVHVIPFDQARFVDENEQKDGKFSEEIAQGSLPFNGQSLEQAVKEELAFHEIELIPYEQSC